MIQGRIRRCDSELHAIMYGPRIEHTSPSLALRHVDLHTSVAVVAWCDVMGSARALPQCKIEGPLLCTPSGFDPRAAAVPSYDPSSIGEWRKL